MTITREELPALVREELSRLLTSVPAVQYELIGVMAHTFAQRTDLQAVLEHIDAQGERIDAQGERIEALREDFNRQFAEHSRRMDHFAAVQEEHSRRMDAFSQRMDAFSQRMDELREDSNRQFAEHSRRMDHFAAVQEEHSRRMDEFSQRMNELREDFNRGFAHLSGRIDRMESTLGALGARWGMMAESAFREGLIGVLRQTGWQVKNYRKMDTRGIVFAEPDQVEIDVVIHDGTHSLIEIKSSISRGDVEHFYRKVAFYEQEEGVKVERMLIISPMFDPRARKLALLRGMEVYSSAYDVSGP